MDERGWVSERLRTIPARLSATARLGERARATPDVIRLASGEPDFVTPSYIREAAKKAIDAGYTFYTSSIGISEFREAVAEKMRHDYGLDIDPETEILATVGGKEAIFIAIMSLIDPGDEVIIPDPSYMGYESNVSLAQGKSVRVNLSEEKNYTLNPEGIVEKVSQRTKMLILNSPNNPTGSVFEKGLLKEMSEISDDHNLLLLADDAYEKFVYDNAEHFNIMQFGKNERRIVVGTLSKTYAMTGWRIGYLIADKELVRQFALMKSNISNCTPSFVQKAAVAALNGPQQWSETVKEFDNRRRFLVSQLNTIDGFSCRLPRGAFYVFPRISRFGMNSIDFAEFLLKEAKVAVYPGVAFGDQGEGHVRITYAASLANIKEAIERIKHCVSVSQ